MPQEDKPHNSGVEDAPGNARDREMGRTTEALGDLGNGHETWKPPAGEQGTSNRPDDDGTETDTNPSPLNAPEQQDDPEHADDLELEKGEDDDGEGQGEGEGEDEEGELEEGL